jgi:hypothetical protein
VQTASETTINKLSSNLDQQWKAVLDNAKDDARASRIGTVDPLAKQWAAGDPRLELVIHTKMLQKLEFPQTFYEAVVWPSAVGFQQKPSYARQINAQVSTTVVQSTATTGTGLTENQKLQESAALLYMSSTQARRGMAAFNPTEAVGSFAVGSTTLLHYFPNPTFPCFVDNWGQPIAFIRWPGGWPSNGVGSPSPPADLNDLPFATTATFSSPAATVRIDPADPEALLYLGTQNWPAATRLQFATTLHPLPTAFDNTMNGMLNLSPVIFSAGPGKDTDSSSNGITDYGVTATLGTPLIMPNPSAEFDNLYSYRTRGQGRQ